MEPFANAVGLGVFDLGFGVVDIVDCQEELVIVFVGSPTKLGSAIRHDAQNGKPMFLVEL